MGINGDTYGQNLAGLRSWSSGFAATYGDYVISNEHAASSLAAMSYHEGDSLDATMWARFAAFETNSSSK